MAAEGQEIDEIQITPLKRDSLQNFWLFNGRGKTGHIAEEVELLARRCRTVAPNSIKQELYYERRPHSTAGTPFNFGSQKRTRTVRSRISGQKSATRNLKSEGFRKVLQKFQPPSKKDYSIGPGYVISKKKHEIMAKIKTGEFKESTTPPPAVDNRRRSEPNKEVYVDESVIDDLKANIYFLTATLEDEKLKYRFQIKQINDEHVKEISILRDEHADHLKAVGEDHEEDMREVERKHKMVLQSIEDEATRAKDELLSELKTTQGAFEIFKVNTMKEFDSKWKERELELELDYGRKAEKLLANQKTELVNEKNKALDALTKEHRKHIQVIVEANKKEMEVLLKKFTATVEKEEVEQVESEIALVKEELDRSRTLNRSMQNQLHDLKVKLQMYKDHFAEKVSEVDAKYSQKIKDLMVDNSKIRQQYMKKCDELYNIKSEKDERKEDDLMTAKDVLQKLILSRARADVSLTALRDDAATDEIPLNEPPTDARTSKSAIRSRPSSAPSTDRETKEAVRDSSKGMTVDAIDAQQRSLRPLSSYYRRAQALNQNRLSQDRLSHDRLNQDRLSQSRLNLDRLSHDRLNQDRLSHDRLNQDRLNLDRLSQDRLSNDRLNQDRLNLDRLNLDRLSQDRLSHDRLSHDRLNQDRLSQSRLSQDRLSFKRSGQLFALTQDGASGATSPNAPVILVNNPPEDSSSDHEG